MPVVMGKVMLPAVVVYIILYGAAWWHEQDGKIRIIG